jgi:uncharacterized damage-inducible protein DinB
MATERAKQRSRDRRQPVDLGRALVEAFLTNERVNHVLLDLIDPAIWNRFPACSPRRSIATSFAHMHNVRCMRLRMSGKGIAAPPRLSRAAVTMAGARAAMAASAASMVRLIERCLADGGHVPDFRPDVIALVCAAITHEAHHRGQICHWARELGAPLAPEEQLQLWDWHRLWKQIPAG